MAEYDKNRNPIHQPKSTVNHDKEWREATHLEFYKRYGAWWVFTGVKNSNKVGWVQQFNTEYKRNKKEALNGKSKNKTVRGKIN